MARKRDVSAWSLFLSLLRVNVKTAAAETDKNECGKRYASAYHRRAPVDGSPVSRSCCNRKSAIILFTLVSLAVVFLSAVAPFWAYASR